MLLIILTWIYISIISFIVGNAFLSFMLKGETFKVKKTPYVIITGLMVLMVYAEGFSLVYKVGLLANIVLLAITALLAVLTRKSLLLRLEDIVKNVTPVRAIIFTVLVIVFAYGTSKGYMHYDTDLYHAQSIRWIEEYGVVPGLGNLHSRLAYNSGAFCLQALFSFAFISGRSLHTCAGYLALVVSFITGDMFTKENFKSISLKCIPRIVTIYYLINIYDEMVSPASDYYIALLVLTIAMAVTDLVVDGVNDYAPYALLSLLGLMVLSVKISGSFVILIVIYPAYVLIRSKAFKTIAKYIITGIISVLPFFLRNIILSGYLIYPLPSIDLFNFDYKIPKVMAQYDADEIEVFGRGHSDVTRINEGLMDWLPDWVHSLDAVNRICFYAAVLSIVVFVFYVVYIFIKKRYDRLKILLVEAVFELCFVVWIFTAPNIRYGCIFLYLAPAITLGQFYMEFISRFDKGIALKAFAVLFLVYKCFAWGSETVKNFSTEYLLVQQDYGEYDLTAYDLNGYTFYYPEEGDQTGYYLFPASPVKAEDIMRGSEIKDGFKDVIHQEGYMQ